MESHYRSELESVKNEIAQTSSLLKQFLRSKNREETSAQPLMKAPTTHTSHTPQTLGVNLEIKQHFILIALVQSTQTLMTMDLIAEGSFDDISIGPKECDK